MGLVWLVYEQDGRKAVVIERGGFVLAARLRASIAHDIDHCFREGHVLPAGAAVAPALIGQPLTTKQAARVLATLQA